MPDIVENFSKGLEYLLDSSTVPQKELAPKMGISTQTLTDYKMGRRRGTETKRNNIARALGFDEYRVRKLGSMIRSGVPGKEALALLHAHDAGKEPNMQDREASAFKVTLESLFSQVIEFLRDRYGESLHVAAGFESIFLERFQEFAQWKREMSHEIWEHPETSLAEPEPEYKVEQPPETPK